MLLLTDDIPITPTSSVTPVAFEATGMGLGGRIGRIQLPGEINPVTVVPLAADNPFHDAFFEPEIKEIAAVREATEEANPFTVSVPARSQRVVQDVQDADVFSRSKLLESKAYEKGLLEGSRQMSQHHEVTLTVTLTRTLAPSITRNPKS